MWKQLLSITAGTVGLSLGVACRGDIDPVSGIDFVQIGAVGNATWAGDGTPGDRAIGRGGVNYEYRIGKYEVTSAQWAEFFTAAFDRAPGDTIPHLTPPDFWGGVPTTPTHTENPSARAWTTTAQSAMLPTGNISWRMAAIYCNWLCNGKATNREAFLTGAYDVSTFGSNGMGFTDQVTRSPGAAYFIPTWDETLKAMHYDPNRVNPNGTTGGWWRSSNRTDGPYTYGPPGLLINGLPTQANALWDVGQYGLNPFAVPLGAYPTVTTPWGLFDAAGGTTEWTEEILGAGGGLFHEDRGTEGSFWTSSAGTYAADWAGSLGASSFPSDSSYIYGFRVAATVPSPNALVAVGAFCIFAPRRRRQGGLHAQRCIPVVRRIAGSSRERQHHR